jgi:hypothetical protein
MHTNIRAKFIQERALEENIYLNCLLDIKESQNIASLHKQIAACDTVLEVCTAEWNQWRSGNGRDRASAQKRRKKIEGCGR